MTPEEIQKHREAKARAARLRQATGRIAGIGAAVSVLALTLLVLVGSFRQSVFPACLLGVPLGALVGGILRATVDDDWPGFRRRANDVEAARELRYHAEMTGLPVTHLSVLRSGDVIPDMTGEHAPLRAVPGHRAGAQ